MASKGRIYIAGPMRGIPHWNFPAFDEAERKWREAGWMVASPASIDRALGIEAPESGSGSSAAGDTIPMRRAMALDIQLIYHSTAIGLLPGWEGSTGATLELSLALFLKLEIYCAVTMEYADPDRLPWQELKHYQRKGA